MFNEFLSTDCCCNCGDGGGVAAADVIISVAVFIVAPTIDDVDVCVTKIVGLYFPELPLQSGSKFTYRN